MSLLCTPCRYIKEVKGDSRCVIMDSAYMGDIMAQIGHDEWRLNMLGMAQSKCTGVDVEFYVNKMKVGTYQLCFWEHKTKNLVYLAWLDNAMAKTLFNHHGAHVLDEGNGLMRRGQDKSRAREMRQKAVRR
jgi:hypothetical protein